MPPLPPVPFALRCHLTGVNQTQPWMNTFHIKYFGGLPSQGDLDLLAGGVALAWQSAIAPHVLSSCALEGVKLVDLSSSTGAEGTHTVNYAGADIGSPLPVNIACVISWPISLRWRGGHFRTYMCGMAAAKITADGAHWDPTWLTTVAGAWDAFRGAIAGLTGANQPYGLIGVRYTGQQTDITFPFVANLGTPAAHSRVDTQRRRLGPELS